MNRPPIILIVEDQDVVRDMTKQRLMRLGYETITTSNGKDALDVIEDNENIDCVLLDIHLPDLSGNEVLEIARRNHNHIDLPIIMMTSEGDPESVLKAFDLGANDYVTKDIPFSITLRRLNTQLEMKQMARDAERASEVKALSAAIVTYCHQINNPLAICWGNLGKNFEDLTPEKFQKTRGGLERIREMMKKVQNIDVMNIEYDEYTKTTQMLKLD